MGLQGTEAGTVDWPVTGGSLTPIYIQIQIDDLNASDPTQLLFLISFQYKQGQCVVCYHVTAVF